MLEFETILAKASADRVSMRDPNKRYHIMTKKELAALAPDFDWDTYFKLVDAPAFETLNVSAARLPQAARGTRCTAKAFDAWKAYFEFHLLRPRAAELPEAFENESFDFWQRYLTGVQGAASAPVPLRQVVDRQLGDLLGQKYIELAFGADAKAQITQLVDHLEKALGEDIKTLDWMTDRHQKSGARQTASHHQQRGNPKKWRDYSKVTIARDDYLRQCRRAWRKPCTGSALRKSASPPIRPSGP